MWKVCVEYKLEDFKNNKWMVVDDYEKFFNILSEIEKVSLDYKFIIMEVSKYFGDYYVNGLVKDIVKVCIYWIWVQ